MMTNPTIPTPTGPKPQALRTAMTLVSVLLFAVFTTSEAPAATCPTCVIGYPYSSTNPLTSVVFNESTVLKAFNTNVTGIADTIRAWYSDEHALTLGIR